LADDAACFAQADWDLHRALTLASGNPIFGLILNGFADFYIQMASRYFEQPQARASSRAWYAELLSAARAHDADQAELVTRQVMQQSIELWQTFVV
jgi:GntR family negative regulator for fad regulon and positive regulator of fabA